jgi:hypothetical protein
MADLGMKAISPENWCEPDPTNAMLGWSPNPEAVVAELMRPQLSARVPLDLAQLFETARGAMCYGLLFYPLWTVGAEQLFRVMEAAVRVRCQELQATGRDLHNFKAMIEFLEATVPASVAGINWDGIRFRRNEAAHPKFQTFMGPALAMPVVEPVADALNRLFEVP